MGLTTTHHAWQGGYSAFHRWRMELAKAAGIPFPLMEGVWGYEAFDGPDHQKHVLRCHLVDMLRRYPHGFMIRAALEACLRWLPIRWDHYYRSGDPLVYLLDHSDCDGWIETEHLTPLANRLEDLLRGIPPELDLGEHIGNTHDKTRTFIAGCRLAAGLGERLGFQ
jgi:hypothetical protein